MKGILEEIVAHKRMEVESRKRKTSPHELQQAVTAMPTVRDFGRALRRLDGPVKMLAEIKAASPSTGTIRSDFDPGEIASAYQSSGAAAISVLTDERYFSGTDEHLCAARSVVTLPVLRKDFTIDEYQLLESRAMGADAVLLMAQVLDEDSFITLYQKAKELGLFVVAEGHSKEQIEYLVSMNAEIIGINNRDFDTMTVDLETTLCRRSLIPEDRVVVSQSGIFARSDVLLLESVGVDAIQVGTSLMQSTGGENLIQKLLQTSEP